MKKRIMAVILSVLLFSSCTGCSGDTVVTEQAVQKCKRKSPFPSGEMTHGMTIRWQQLKHLKIFIRASR